MDEEHMVLINFEKISTASIESLLYLLGCLSCGVELHDPRIIRP